MAITLKFIKDIMAIPSCSAHEGMLRQRILDFAAERGIESRVDAKGNVYLTKGTLAEGECYPCLVNHMDTVQFNQAELADAGRKLELLERRTGDGKTVLYARGTGIGADDKLGCAIALALLDNREKCKAVFFVEEEFGMQGSRVMDVEWFKDVSFCLSFDSPERNRSSRSCHGRQLFTDHFFKTVLEPVANRHGITRFNHEPFTDIVQIRDQTNIMCYNVGNGGYRAHLPDEYLVVEDTQAAYAFGVDFLDTIGMHFTMRMRNPFAHDETPT